MFACGLLVIMDPLHALFMMKKVFTSCCGSRNSMTCIIFLGLLPLPTYFKPPHLGPFFISNALWFRVYLMVLDLKSNLISLICWQVLNNDECLLVVNNVSRILITPYLPTRMCFYYDVEATKSTTYIVVLGLLPFSSILLLPIQDISYQQCTTWYDISWGYVFEIHPFCLEFADNFCTMIDVHLWLLI